MNDAPLPQSSQELEELMERAAQRGATEALRRVGLHDEDAGKDISDLRTVLEHWREIKRATLKTVATWITGGILALLALGAWSNMGGKK